MSSSMRTLTLKLPVGDIEWPPCTSLAGILYKGKSDAVTRSCQT